MIEFYSGPVMETKGNNVDYQLDILHSIMYSPVNPNHFVIAGTTGAFLMDVRHSLLTGYKILF